MDHFKAAIEEKQKKEESPGKDFPQKEKKRN